MYYKSKVMRTTTLRILLISATAFLFIQMFTQCALPKYLYFDVEQADTTSFNLNPAGSNVTVIGVEDSLTTSVAYHRVVASIAVKYETDQALDEEVVSVYTIPAREFDITNLQYLNSLADNCNSDLLIIVSGFKYGKSYSENIYMPEYEATAIIKVIPFSLKVDIFDARKNEVIKSMPIEDKIVAEFSDYSEFIRNQDRVNELSEFTNTTVGQRIAEYLSTRWHNKEVMIVDYPSDEKWTKATKFLYQFQFDKAIEIWIPYTSEGDDVKKQGYAAYNIAIACIMNGNQDLANQWLSYSRSKYNFGQQLLSTY